jgi:hypothetical protein
LGPIDVVYTWVNGSDPRHIASMLLFVLLLLLLLLLLANEIRKICRCQLKKISRGTGLAKYRDSVLKPDLANMTGEN